MNATRTFIIPAAQDSTKTFAIKIGEPDLKRQHLGLSTWGSSLLLARHLHLIDIASGKEPLHGANNTDAENGDKDLYVLELGAGTGLVGLAAAALWHGTVLLTDLPDVVSNLAANIALNSEILDAVDAKAYAASLDWTFPNRFDVYQGIEQPLRPRNARIVLAADTVYSEDHPTALSRTALSWLERSHMARFIIAYPLRPAYLDYVRELWALLEQGGLHCLGEGKFEADESWDDERLHEWSVWRWNDDVLNQV